MTTIRRIVTSQLEGGNANQNNQDEIRPFGEVAFYLDTNSNPDKLTMMMFDGQRTHIKSKVLQPGVLFGSNGDSGDNYGFDTIKLIPDATLYDQGSDQYIVVDPTGGEPGHIHLRAGGTQDASAADLYLGGELTCVRVSDTSGHITIRTTNVGDPNVTLDWRFETDGNLYFPGIGNNRIGESEPGLVVSSSDALVLQSNNNGENKELLFDTDGSLIFPGGSGQINPSVSDGVGLQVEADLDFEIKVTSGEGSAIWSFAGGEITFPDATIQSTAFTGNGNLTIDGDRITGRYPLQSIVFETDWQGNGGSRNGTALFVNPATLGIDAIEPGWVATFSGGLTKVVDGAFLDGAQGFYVISFEGSSFNYSYPVTVSSSAEASKVEIAVGSNVWQFGEDGSLTVPGKITGGDVSNNLDITAGNYITIESANGGQVMIGSNQLVGGNTGPVVIGHSGNSISLSGGKLRIQNTAVPISSIGDAGDVAGLAAFDGSYIYYCTADYTDGLSNIWKRVAWSNDTW